MARTLKSDKTLFLLTTLLVGASIVMVYSASSVQAANKFQASYYFLAKQVVWSVLGFVLMFGAMQIDYHDYRRPAVIWSLLGVTGALLLAVFFEPRINGTQRWLSFRLFSLQPSELAKLSVIVFTAAILERRMHRIADLAYAVAPIAIVTFGLAGLVLLEPDFGTAVSIVLIAIAMLYASGLRYRHLLTAFFAITPAAIALVVLKAYRFKRVLAFLDPEGTKLGDGFQLYQSLIALGSGGMIGRGLGGSMQKLFYLPEAHTDFIFSIIGEELGLIGTTVILGAFALLAWRGLRVALLAPDRFGSLLAVGITMMIAVQAMLNITVVTGLAPTKGLPLPFVSNGGSSLLINMVAMGVLLNISQQASSTVAATMKRTDWTLGGQEA
ncbi:MAG TPA: putative lipid II flippase FtsW [Vicinamibacterales bacterium]|jgi:cell division protein FtsW|nr:putative lipid II flippase FtsW [Vicinamibacterales bacterium]